MKRSPIWMARSLAILMLAGSVTAASAQTDQEHDAHHPDGAPATDAVPAPQAGSGMGMNPDMMQMMQQLMGQRQGRMGPGMMGRGGMMRAMFAIMDADGDGALSREEFDEAHGRIFSHMDADGNGQVTLEDMQAFMGGSTIPAGEMPMREATPMDHALSESAQAYMDAMQTMMDGMEGMEMKGEPNADFALMMIPHHQSAIDMAEAYLEHGDDPELTNLANEIIAAQQAEIEFLQNWLEESR
ncbi:MAG TPA: DUF305 domain-containing protein [Aestuariivirgaceae bacterium]|nr:DUF305 domain-containing protein [Aestuariivirgaceae bacterium]